MDADDRLTDEEAFDVLQEVREALGNLPAKTFFSSTVEKIGHNRKPTLFVSHHPEIDDHDALAVWQSDVASPIDKSASWQREGGACDFEGWDQYWPASLSQFMIPWVLEGLARHHLSRVVDILVGDLVGGTPAESLEIQFQLWHSLVTNLAIIGKGSEGKEDAEVALKQLQLHATVFYEWERLNVGSQLDDVAATNFASTTRMFQDLGLRRN
jgi:hypothetical protein